jgi:hypothetical protein
VPPIFSGVSPVPASTVATPILLSSGQLGLLFSSLPDRPPAAAIAVPGQ